MAYTPTTWVDGSPPYLNATNLNKLEAGVDGAHDAIDALGTAASADTGDFATAAQGALADTATQPGDLGGAAALNVGTTTGTVAAGDDSRFPSTQRVYLVTRSGTDWKFDGATITTRPSVPTYPNGIVEVDSSLDATVDSFNGGTVSVEDITTTGDRWRPHGSVGTPTVV